MVREGIERIMFKDKTSNAAFICEICAGKEFDPRKVEVNTLFHFGRADEPINVCKTCFGVNWITFTSKAMTGEEYRAWVLDREKNRLSRRVG